MDIKLSFTPFFFRNISMKISLRASATTQKSSNRPQCGGRDGISSAAGGDARGRGRPRSRAVAPGGRYRCGLAKRRVNGVGSCRRAGRRTRDRCGSEETPFWRHDRMVTGERPSTTAVRSAETNQR
jgi:hypothetical protein